MLKINPIIGEQTIQTKTVIYKTNGKNHQLSFFFKKINSKTKNSKNYLFFFYYLF